MSVTRASGVLLLLLTTACLVCGALFVSEPFAETYSAAWTLDELSLALSPDGRELRIEGAREESNGVSYRLTFPSTCPGVPLTEDVHSGE